VAIAANPVVSSLTGRSSVTVGDLKRDRIPPSAFLSRTLSSVANIISRTVDGNSDDTMSPVLAAAFRTTFCLCSTFLSIFYPQEMRIKQYALVSDQVNVTFYQT
jgi:hypothetical protein